MVCEVKSGTKILPPYSPLDKKLNNNFNQEKMQACMELNSPSEN